jgi:hypothetical protein
LALLTDLGAALAALTFAAATVAGVLLAVFATGFTSTFFVGFAAVDFLTLEDEDFAAAAGFAADLAGDFAAGADLAIFAIGFAAFAIGFATGLPTPADLCFKAVGFAVAGFAALVGATAFLMFAAFEAATGEDTFLLCAMFSSHSFVHATHCTGYDRGCDIEGPTKSGCPRNRLLYQLTHTTEPMHAATTHADTSVTGINAST